MDHLKKLGVTPSMLGEVAYADPQLAYALMNWQKAYVGSYADVGGWEVVNVQGTFGASTVANINNDGSIPTDQIIKGQTFGIVEADLWIRKVTYTVKRPRAFAGNVFKAQSDYFNSLNPNINVNLTIASYSRYVIASDFMPLENISMAFEATAPAGLIFRFSSSVQAQFINTRELATDENPTTATISFHGTRIPPEIYGSISPDKARHWLMQKGVLPQGDE